MTQFVKEFDILDKPIQQQICSFFKNNTKEFNVSMIYNTKEEQKLHDLDKRQSYFRTFTDSIIFNLVQKYINEINKLDDIYTYILVKNDITQVKYYQGGYFKPHEDYLSLITNVIQEYTLLMCLDADCIGGETVLHLNKYFKHSSKATTTPLHGLLFRKDITHEGCKIEKGTKEIMMVNLWAVKKNSPAIVIMRFKDDNRTHVIELNNILNMHDNVLKSYVEYYDYSSKRFIEYMESEWTFEECNVIQKIYNDEVITYDELHKYKNIVDYYGFTYEHILVKAGNSITKYNELCHQDDIILCENKARYKEMLHIVKKGMNLMPFTIIMAEGVYVIDDNMIDMSMNPIYVAFSENNNVMFYSHLKQNNISNNTKLYDIERDLDIFDMCEECILDGYDDDEISEILWDGYGTNSTGCDVYINSDPLLLIKCNYNDQLLLAKDKKLIDTYDYYGIDEDNNLTINREHRQAVIDRVKELKLYKTIINMMNNTNFTFPQSDFSESDHFCNESYYGKFTLMSLHGFMKMI